MTLGSAPGAGEKSMKYYNRGQDNPVDGTQFTAELVTFLRDVLHREANDHPLKLSPEGLAGLTGLLNMMQRCLREISDELQSETRNA